jgi:ATP-binding cassette subfamily F protein 3
VRNERGNGAPGPGDGRRVARRDAAERRVALEPLRRKSRQAEQMAARLAAEQRTLDTRLAAPNAFRGDGPALGDALKRRAELARLIAEAETEWIEAESEIERITQS